MKTKGTVLLAFIFAFAAGLPALAQTDSGTSSVDFTVQDSTTITFSADWAPTNVTWEATETTNITDGIQYETNSGVEKVIQHSATPTSTGPVAGATDDIVIDLQASNATSTDGDAGTGSTITVWDGPNGDQSTTDLITGIGATNGVVTNGAADVDWTLNVNNAQQGTYNFTFELTISNAP